jgi:hypothetical protein
MCSLAVKMKQLRENKKKPTGDYEEKREGIPNKTNADHVCILTRN